MATSGSSHQSQVNEALQRLQQLKNEGTNGWEEKESKNEAKLYEKIHGMTKDNVEIHVGKATITVDAPARVVFDVVWNQEKEWNSPTIAEFQIVEELEKDRTQVVYVLHKTLSAASSRRDLVYVRTVQQQNAQRYTIVQTSVVDAKAPPKAGLIRASLLYSGVFIEEENAKTTVTAISCMDFGAWLHEKFIEGEVVRVAQRLAKIKEKSLQKLPR